MVATNLKVKVDFESRKASNRKARRAGAYGKVVSIFKNKPAKKPQTLSPQAIENLILEFQPQARKMGLSILRRWHARLDLQEVYSVVDLSLCEAARRFNPNKGASFITFLFYHLRGNLIRAVSSAAKLNAVPFSDIEGSVSVSEDGEVSRGLEARGISAVEVADALSNRESHMPDEILMKKELVTASLNACNKLDKLEREVLFRIYLQEEQLLDVACSLGYSRCHISRVKRNAIETLQRDMAGYQEENRVPEVEMPVPAKGSSRRSVLRRKPRSAQILRHRGLRSTSFDELLANS